MQPNAPGTQGYNLYAYVANNPTTWVDPSGHIAIEAAAAITTQVFANPALVSGMVATCAVAAGANVTQAAATGAAGAAVTATWGRTPGAGLAFGVCVIAVTIRVTIPVLVCVFTPECREAAWEQAQIIAANGANTFEGAGEWTVEELQNAVDTFPDVPNVTTLFSGSDTFKGTSAPRDFANRHGLESWEVRKAIERLKGKSGVPPAGDVEIEKNTGEVIDPRTGEDIGNIFDELPYVD